jgi:hypothetical protein
MLILFTTHTSLLATTYFVHHFWALLHSNKGTQIKPAFAALL